MNLVIPPEYKESVSGVSGFISASSIYSKKTTKGLFLDPVNRKYLHKELCTLLTHPGYIATVARNINVDRVPDFTDYIESLDNINELIENWKLPYSEEMVINNPVLELHHINTNFLSTIVQMLVASPDILDIDYYHRSDGGIDKGEWDYGAASYSDGTWHPEHLFTESQQNRNTSYWKPINITVSSGDYDKWTPQKNHYCLSARRGHKYESKAYGDYDNPNYDRRGFSASTIFPRWQYNYRHHDRNISEGFAEGGHGDRRTQQGRKYDMSALFSKPH